MMSAPRWAQVFHGVQHLAVFGIAGGLAQERRGHQDGLENVVQVVGDAAGQRADAFHALGAEEIGFKLFPFRDVRVDGEDFLGPALFIAQQGPAAEDDELFARLVGHFQFAGPAALLQQRRVRRLKSLAVILCPTR